MPDTLNQAQRSYCMSYIRSKDTLIEVSLRKLLWHAGYRYSKNYARLPGTPDIAITKLRRRVDAMLLLSKSEAFDLIAQHLNELIDTNRAAMKAKKTAKKGSKENDGTPVEVEV